MYYFNSIDVVKNVGHLKTISNVEIHVHSIVTIPTREIGKCTTNTPCVCSASYQSSLVFFILVDGLFILMLVVVGHPADLALALPPALLAEELSI